MTDEERKETLDELGREIADLFPEQFGSVRFNLKNGEFMSYNIETSHLPKKLLKELEKDEMYSS